MTLRSASWVRYPWSTGGECSRDGRMTEYKRPKLVELAWAMRAAETDEIGRMFDVARILHDEIKCLQSDLEWERNHQQAEQGWGY